VAELEQKIDTLTKALKSDRLAAPVQLPTGGSSCNSNNKNWSLQVIAAEDAGSASSINGRAV
jgi:hypothetical protein